jgi:hypothetical protein
MPRGGSIMRFVRPFVPFLAVLALGASSQAQEDQQIFVEAKFVVVSSSNPAAGGARYGPNFYGLPGDILTAQLVVEPGPIGVSSYSISCRFDEDLQNELDLMSVTPMGPSNGGIVTVESNGTQAGEIQSVNGAFAPPLGPLDGDAAIAEAEFVINTPLEGPPDLTCGLFNDPPDQLLDPTGATVDPNDVIFPGTSILPATQSWSPTFADKFEAYNFGVDVLDGNFAPDPKAYSLKTKTICKHDCPEKTRGVLGLSKHDGVFFVQPPVAVETLAITNTLTVNLDVSRMHTPGSTAAVEVDTPFVPIGGSFDNFVFFQVVRESNGDLSLFPSERISGGTVDPIASPLPIPGASETVTIDFSWWNDAITVMAGPMGGPLASVVADYPFVFDTNAGVGIGGTANEKGEKLGFDVDLGGDLAMEIGDPAASATRKMVLDDLKGVIDLEVKALADLDAAGQDAKQWKEAKEKIMRALEKLEKGDKIPNSNPPMFQNPLIDKAYMEAMAGGNAAVAKEVKKTLEKAVKRDEQAIKRIDVAIGRIEGGKSLTKLDKDKVTAKKFVDKARKEKVSAKAVIETRAKKDAKGV